MASSEEILKVPLHQQPLRQLNRIARRPPVSVEFQDLIYSVRDSYGKSGWRQLLKSVNGQFKSGELTAIMGPSGAGKSTLLNILAGYVTAGVKGSIRINGRPRNLKIFNKLCSYIMQEDLLQPRLTVREAMMVAANLKLGSRIGQSEKESVVEEVISLLGLEKCFDTFSEYLSGGQRKRLVIALELVNNPPVLFLDEPTTGLDNVAIKQCMELLYKITKLGRTVICTIHQPPASMFQRFDQVYIMANGCCVYNGSPSRLVPFMTNVNCPCPPTYTPAEYILEIVQSTPESTGILSAQIQNGKTNLKDKFNSESGSSCFEICNDIFEENIMEKPSKYDMVYPLSVWAQFCIILGRMFLQIKRNKVMIYTQFFHHLISGLLIGGVFIGTGNDASQAISIFKYCISINVFFMYTYVMVPVLLFPFEVKLMKREYFNRWYSLKAYYFAYSIASIPLLVLFGIMFLAIVYFMTDQPLDAHRFVWFNLIALSVGLCSQGLGYVIGSTFNITIGSVVGSSVLAPLLALAVYGMGYQSGVEPLMKVMMGFSFLRFGLVGLCTTLFVKRPPLECDEIYCHYKNSQMLLVDMGMGGEVEQTQFYFIFAFMMLFRVVSYACLKYRMSAEISNKIVYYATKIVRQKE